MPRSVAVLVELEVAGLQPSHSAALAATDDFLTYVRETTGIKLLNSLEASTVGAKGAWEQIVLSVSSPAAIVTILRLWLQRDRRRSIHVRINAADQPVTDISAEGEHISLKALENIVESALESGDTDPRV